MARLSLSALRKLLRNRDYTAFLIGNFLSQTGDWAQRLAVGWLAWELTHSPFWLGLILFADLAPTIIFSPIGGAYVDRLDRLMVTRVTVWLGLIQPVLLVVLYFTDLLDIWLLLGATVYIGIIHAFNQTARLAMVPLLVPQEDIAAAMPLNSVGFNASRFAGPALFGVITLFAPAGYALILNVIAYVLFGAILARVKIRTEFQDKAEGRNILRDSWEGVRYALTHPGIGPLLIVLVASSFGTRAFMDLLPGFADAVFGRGPEALSIMTSTVAAGALLGAVYLILRNSLVGLSNLAMLTSMLTGVGLIIFTATDNFWFAVSVLFFVGIGLAVSATGVMTLAQANVKGEMRGRVLATYGIIFRGGPALGGLAMGWIAEWTGLRWPVAGGGLLCVLVWFWVLRRLPEVRRILESDHPPKE